MLPDVVIPRTPEHRSDDGVGTEVGAMVVVVVVVIIVEATVDAGVDDNGGCDVDGNVAVDDNGDDDDDDDDDTVEVGISSKVTVTVNPVLTTE